MLFEQLCEQCDTLGVLLDRLKREAEPCAVFADPPRSIRLEVCAGNIADTLFEHLVANGGYIGRFRHGQPYIAAALWNRPCCAGVTEILCQGSHHRISFGPQYRIERIAVRIEVISQKPFDRQRSELVGAAANLESQRPAHNFGGRREVAQAKTRGKQL